MKFAPHKTKAMLITRRLKYDSPLLHMGGVGIELETEIKLLGLTIDNKLTFNAHARNTCDKVFAIYKQLSRAAKITWGLQPEIIRTIYTAVIEPIVLYASSAWAPATRKLGVRKQLNLIQRAFAQKICKAYRTVSLNSSLVLAGLLPLDLRVQEMAELYEAKRRGSHPEICDRVIETRSSFMSAPHPATIDDFEYECLEDESQIENQGNGGHRIYTDGSRIEEKVGAALSWWYDGAETRAQKYKLDPMCTVYQAEMYAVLRATESIIKSGGMDFGIYSDSRSTLEVLGNHDSFHPLKILIQENITKIKGQNKTLAWFWIRAHVGTEGNERADFLAKEAALNGKKKADYDACPISFIKKQIRSKTQKLWNERYVSEGTAAGTKIFLPDAVEAYGIIRKLELSPVMVQIMTGHGGFSEYLHRFKCKDDPSCICEPGVSESILHILVDCPVFAKQRHEIENKIDNCINKCNIKDIIRDKKAREDFLEYCIKICVIVINRNKTTI